MTKKFFKDLKVGDYVYIISRQDNVTFSTYKPKISLIEPKTKGQLQIYFGRALGAVVLANSYMVEIVGTYIYSDYGFYLGAFETVKEKGIECLQAKEAVDE